MQALINDLRGRLQGGLVSLRARGFLYNVVVLSGGTVIGQALVVLTSPIITRLYQPSDLGNLSVYISMASILGVIASWRYETAIPLPQDDETAANLLSLCLTIILAFTGFIGLIIFFFSERILDLVNAPVLRPYLWLLPFSFLAMGLYQVLNYWAIRMDAYISIARTKYSQSIGRVITQVTLGLLSRGPAGLLVGDLVGRSSGIYTLASLTWRRNRNIFRTISLKRMSQVAMRYRRFPLIAMGGNLLNSLNLYLPLLITTAFYGTQISGILMLSQTVLGIPSLFLANAISQAYFGESARILKNNPANQMNLFWKTFWRLSIIGTPAFLVISFLSPWLFRIFGKGWNDSAIFVQYLTPMFIIQFIGSPLSAILDVLERQDLYVVGEVSRIITLGIAAYLGKTLYGNEPTSWILLYSIVASIAYIISISLSWYAIRVTHKEQTV